MSKIYIFFYSFPLELSQSYLFFWDKVERANYFLNTIVSVYKRDPKETPEGRLVSFLLSNEAIAADGGTYIIKMPVSEFEISIANFARNYSES